MDNLIIDGKVPTHLIKFNIFIFIYDINLIISNMKNIYYYF